MADETEYAMEEDVWLRDEDCLVQLMIPGKKRMAVGQGDNGGGNEHQTV